jgi:hypothetical protein
LILGAADYAEDNGDPPPELRLAMNCRAWGCLPEAGGLQDQPAGLITRMNVCLNVYDAMRASIKAKDKVTWAKENPEAYEIMQDVIRMRNGG